MILGFTGFGLWNEQCFDKIQSGSNILLIHYQGFNIYICATAIIIVVLLLNLFVPSEDPITKVSLDVGPTV